MKKIIGIIAIVIVLLLFIYMMISQKSAIKPTVTGQEDATVANKPAVVVDEQALALEELQRELRKSGLSKLYIVKCSSCHGRDGKGPVGSSIAGKTPEYNLAILMKYKENLVPNTLMKGLLEKTSIEQLNQLADEISSFK